jgi:hypothetical protein
MVRGGVPGGLVSTVRGGVIGALVSTVRGGVDGARVSTVRGGVVGCGSAWAAEAANVSASRVARMAVIEGLLVVHTKDTRLRDMSHAITSIDQRCENTAWCAALLPVKVLFARPRARGRLHPPMSRACWLILACTIACGSSHDRPTPDARAPGATASDAPRAGDAHAADAIEPSDAPPHVSIDAPPDPCAGVTCTTPPAAACSNLATLVTYASTGTCSAGTCQYAATMQTCTNGCDVSTCVGAATNACGVCDRDWQCDAALDHWSSFYDSDGLGCRDDRTGTTLRCNGSLDNDPDDSWTTTSWGMELVFGGVLGTHIVECDPAP